ncbi:MAG: hypothetical protein P9X24_14540 [Candidatus Hatepunaea meridiana]|nr:hypothetical protein [Candidatus Hatepunaea meridiana]
MENKENKNDGKRNLWDSILAIASIVAIIVATIAIFQTNNILKLTNEGLSEMKTSNKISLLTFINTSDSLRVIVNTSTNKPGILSEIRFAYDINVSGDTPAFNCLTKSGMIGTPSDSINNIINNATLKNVILPGEPHICKANRMFSIRGNITNKSIDESTIIITDDNNEVIETNKPIYFGILCEYYDIIGNKYEFWSVYEILFYNNLNVHTRILSSYYKTHPFMNIE